MPTHTITNAKHILLLSSSVNKIYLITEFAQRGDLMNIARTCNLTADHLRSITRQIMTGLQYLHDNCITHNDLKPSNILLTQDGTVKIADFGVSGLGRIRMDSCGTPSFMAPEGNCSTISIEQLFVSILPDLYFFPYIPLSSRLRRTARRSASRLLFTRGYNILCQIWQTTVCWQGT